MPAAIAPLETSTTSRPCLTQSAICSAQRESAARSSPRPWSVTRLEPTLTTSRFAFSRTEDINKNLSTHRTQRKYHYRIELPWL